MRLMNDVKSEFNSDELSIREDCLVINFENAILIPFVITMTHTRY